MTHEHTHQPHAHSHADGTDCHCEPVAATGTAIDPVCGMDVDTATAGLTAEHEGTTYYFCSAGCRSAFIAQPSRYLQ